MTVGDIKTYLHCDGCGAPSLRSEIIEETPQVDGTVHIVTHTQRVLWAARVVTRVPPEAADDPAKCPVVLTDLILPAMLFGGAYMGGFSADTAVAIVAVSAYMEARAAKRARTP